MVQILVIQTLSIDRSLPVLEEFSVSVSKNSLGVAPRIVKKVKEPHHKWIIWSDLNAIDIPGALSSRDAHVETGNQMGVVHYRFFPYFSLGQFLQIFYGQVAGLDIHLAWLDGRNTPLTKQKFNFIGFGSPLF